jgi:misacylated tRNA(Ala) deacylase
MAQMASSLRRVTLMKKDMDPRMHSAEHILNQTMVRFFGCGRCFSSHIEKKKSKCDYHFDRPLSEEEIDGVVTKVNEVIRSNLRVSEEFVARPEAEKRFNLGRLPEDAGDPVRIVSIGDYDACPCIGPHVNSTTEIGEFRIISSSFDNDVVRIRFRLYNLTEEISNQPSGIG